MPTAWEKAWWIISLQWSKLSEEQKENVARALATPEKPKPSNS